MSIQRYNFALKIKVKKMLFFDLLSLDAVFVPLIRCLNLGDVACLVYI